MPGAPESLLIRTYSDEDREAVTALWNTVFDYPHDYHRPEASIRRMIATAPDLFFVGEIEDEVVGTVLAGWDGHRGWIYSMAVDPARQRHGIGTALLEHAVEELRRRDCPKVNLQVLATNAAVIAFYERHGFVVEERASLGRRL